MAQAMTNAGELWVIRRTQVPGHSLCSRFGSFHLLENMSYVPLLLISKGVCHYLKYVYIYKQGTPPMNPSLVRLTCTFPLFYAFVCFLDFVSN